MAADDDKPPAPPTSPECTACRGTGKVISNLGGTPSEVACPWCEGSGKWLGGEHDAQAAKRAAAGDETPAADT